MPLLDSPCPRSEAIRSQGVEILNGLLGPGNALYLAVHHAHVNTRGPAFGPLHHLFGDVYGHIGGHVDTLAERVATLGGVALGTLEQIAAAPILAPYPLDLRDGYAHVREVVTRLDQWASLLYGAYDRVEELRLIADVNALATMIEAVEKDGWMLRAHLQR